MYMNKKTFLEFQLKMLQLVSIFTLVTISLCQTWPHAKEVYIEAKINSETRNHLENDTDL